MTDTSALDIWAEAQAQREGETLRDRILGAIEEGDTEALRALSELLHTSDDPCEDLVIGG